MARIRTLRDIAQQFPETAATLQNVVAAEYMERYSTHAFGAAVIPETAFFDQANLPGVCNLERVNELPYDSLVMGVCLQILAPAGAGTIADVTTLRRECEVQLELDSKLTPSLPAAVVPGGGGLKLMAQDLAAGAGLVQYGMNGISNNHFMFERPFFVKKQSNFGGWLRSQALVALNNASIIRMAVIGVEFRDVV